MKFLYCVAMIGVIGTQIGCMSQVRHQPKQMSAASEQHTVKSWVGLVRIVADNMNSQWQEESDESVDESILALTVQQLLESVGVSVEVNCLEGEGNLFNRGAFHAQIKVTFKEKLTTEQENQALKLLESLHPTKAAFEIPKGRGRSEAPMTSSVESSKQ